MEVDRYKLAHAENAIAVLEKRYLKKNQRGESVEKPIDMFRRVALRGMGEKCLQMKTRSQVSAQLTDPDETTTHQKATA